MIDQALSIVGDGPAGTTIFTADRLGARDGSNRFFTPFQHVNWPLLAASVDSYIWECVEGVWQVAGVRCMVSTAGGASAAVDVKVCSGLTAPASGTTQLTAACVLTTAGPSRGDGTLIASPTLILPGDSLAADFSGTLTALVGLLSVQLKRVQ